MKELYGSKAGALTGLLVLAAFLASPAPLYAQDGGSPVRNAPAAVSQLRSIKEIYDSAKPTDAIADARIVLEFNRVSSRLVYFENGQWSNMYYDPVDGKEIKEILEDDPKLDLGQFDDFMEENMHDLTGASLFLDGFIVLSIQNPRYHIIIPVSNTTVNKIIRYLSKPAPQK